MTIGGSRYDVRGGFCTLQKVHLTPTGEVIWLLSVQTGLLTNLPAAPVGNAIWLMIPAGKRVRAGTPLEILDGEIEVPSTRLLPATTNRRGTAILRKRLAGGTFSWREDDGTEIEGSWTCR